MNKEEIRAFSGAVIAALVGALVALAGSQGSLRVGGVPLFALAVGLAYLIQWLAFIPAYLWRTEKFYDLTGSITYTFVTLLAAFLGSKLDARKIIIVILVLTWALRLGAFLFRRVRKAGEDRRFREIKQSLSRFLLAWTLQGLWVTFTLSAALVVLTSARSGPLDAFAIIGLLLWVFGFGFEVVADRQKSAFRTDPANQGKFIRTGLWAWSRHPNYFGEISLWLGVALIALPIMRGWQFVTLISPVFVIIFLTHISGLPMLEKRADEKWGGQPEYETYKKNTPVLIPRPPIK
jgi:steroid 5-alpha reductase family enzyme